jgi:hypothetical protein
MQNALLNSCQIMAFVTHSLCTNYTFGIKTTEYWLLHLPQQSKGLAQHKASEELTIRKIRIFMQGP